MPKPSNFAAIALQWRARRGLTRVQAAEALGVPYRTLEDWESGRRTPRGIYRRLLTEKLRSLKP